MPVRNILENNFSSTIGHRFNWGRKLGLNLEIGYYTDAFFTFRLGIDF